MPTNPLLRRQIWVQGLIVHVALISQNTIFLKRQGYGKPSGLYTAVLVQVKEAQAECIATFSTVVVWQRAIKRIVFLVRETASQHLELVHLYFVFLTSCACQRDATRVNGGCQR